MPRLHEEKGRALILGSAFIVPFLLFGLGILNAPYFFGALIFTLYFCLLIINFEAGFLTLIFIRSSIDYLKNFTGEGGGGIAGPVSIAIIVLGVFYVLYRKADIFFYEDSGPFLIFLALCGVSIAYSPNVKEALFDWLRLVSVFSVYILTRIIFTEPRKIKLLFKVILLSSLIPILVAFYQLATGNGVVYDAGHNRIVGTFLHPNAFASYLLILLIFCTAQILERTNFISKPLMTIMTAMTFIIFIFTFSRGAWFVFVFVMFLMGFMRYRKLLGYLPVVLVVLFLTIPEIGARLVNINEAGYTHGRSGWEWRLETWGEIFEIVREKPFFGHGLSSVEFLFGVLTHNDYLRLLAEVGICGLLGYIFLVGSILKKTWRDYQRADSNISKSFQIGLLAVVVGFVIREFADNTLRNTVTIIYFWIFLAMSRNIAQLDREMSSPSYTTSKNYDWSN